MTYCRPDGGMAAMGAPDNRMVAHLTLGLFGTPRDELAATVDGEVPEWIERLYQSFGTSAESAPASASVLAGADSAEVPKLDRKSTRLNSSHRCISYSCF